MVFKFDKRGGVFIKSVSSILNKLVVNANL